MFTKCICLWPGPISEWCEGYRVNGRDVVVSNADVIVEAGDVLLLVIDKTPDDARLPLEGHVTVNG